MPTTMAVIAAVIVERPLCRPCIAEKVEISPQQLRIALSEMRHVLAIRYEDEDRCRACGAVGPVLYLTRPE